MFYLVGIIITFFLVFILASKKNKSVADKILTLWLFFSGINLLVFYIHFTDKYIEFPYFLGFEIPLPLLQGPFLYLYTSSLTNQNNNRKANVFHFIPCIITYLLLIPFFTLSFTKKIYVYQNEGLGYEQLIAVIFYAIIFSGIIYALLSLKKLYRHKKNIETQFSYTEKINLAWLRYLIIGISIIWLVAIFSDDKYIFATVVLYILFIGYFGIKQVGIFTYNQSNVESLVPVVISTIETENVHIISSLNEATAIKPIPITDTIPEPNFEKNKYVKSGLNDSLVESIHKQLTALMQNEKLSKNPELTLFEIAQKLNVHPNSLSQVINSKEQRNFYDYVNSQRVEEFKQMAILSENHKFTMLALAHECGFNSKTSFNRNFKKVTGLSPTEYLKQVNGSAG